MFTCAVLIVDALIGERGLLRLIHARREFAGAAAALHEMRRENARLRAQIGRLRDDPRTIEEIARRELALIKPGEIVFVVKDIVPQQDR